MKGKYLEGDLAPLRTTSQAKMLCGKVVRYLRACDIDRSGRGYFFPRIGKVEEVFNRQIIFEDGNSVRLSDMREVVIVGDAE